jgi:hypothetical protein
MVSESPEKITQQKASWNDGRINRKRVIGNQANT